MGVADGATHGKRGKRGGRGSVNNGNRLAAFAQGTSGAEADWGGCDPAKLQGILVAITALGGAITLGLSRDGGGHMLTLLLDDNRETLWFNKDAELDEELDKVLAMLEGLS